MGLYDQLSAAVTQVAAKVVADFASATVRVRALAPTRQLDASSKDAWADVTGLTAAPAVITDVDADKAVRTWGTQRRVTSEAAVTIPGTVSLDAIKQDHGIAVLSGARAGQKFRVVGVQVNDVARLATLGLETTTDTLGL